MGREHVGRRATIHVEARVGMRFARLLFLVLLAAPGSGWSESVDFTLGAGANVPLAIPTMDSTAVYVGGEGIVLTADYQLPFFPLLFLQGTAAYDRLDVRGLPGYSLSALGAGPGAGIYLRLSDRLRLKAAADAGYLAAVYNGSWSSSTFVLVSATLTFFINPSFGIGAGASYKMYGTLYTGAGIYVTATYRAKIEDIKD